MRDDKPLFNADVDYGTYTAAHWQEIEKSLAGIDLDATMVSKYPYLAPEHPEQTRAPLREALQNLSNYYAALSRLKPVPRSELAAWLREEESRFETARGVLSDIGAATTDTAAMLTAWIANARGQRAKLVAQGGRIGNKNAKRLHRKFWDDLRTVWLTLPIEQHTHASLRAFLFACSAPIFPANTAHGALTAFTKDHFKPRPRQ